MSNYRVMYAEPEQLSPGQRWAFVECDGRMVFVIRPAHTAQELEDAWEAFRAIPAT